MINTGSRIAFNDIIGDLLPFLFPSLYSASYFISITVSSRLLGINFKVIAVFLIQPKSTYAVG